MYHNNRMKMLYIAWYGSPKRGLTSEHEHYRGGYRGRRRTTPTSRSPAAVHAAKPPNDDTRALGSLASAQG